MTGEITGDLKKAICKSLTSVVKSSPLAIDPKAFFMMLNTNYAVICHDGKLDLGPIWDALTSGHPEDQLYGVFLKFQEKATEHGLEAGLPAPVGALTEEQRLAALAPWSGTTIPNDPSGLEPLPLGTGDLKPAMPEETRRRIIQVVANALRRSPIGPTLDQSQIVFLLDENFDDLCDGSSFDFEPILTGLRETHSFEDRAFYEAMVRARPELSEIGIGTKEPKLDLNAIDKENVSRDIKRADAKEAKERAAALEADPNQKETKEESQARVRAATKKEQLKEYGLQGEKGKPKTSMIRLAVLGVVLLGIGIGAFLSRPNRELPTDPYLASMPVVKASLLSDTFQCVVDEKKWFALPTSERKERILKFQEILKKQGFVQNMQCRDTRKRLVMAYRGEGRIAGAKFFVSGNIDGTINLEEVEEPPPK